MNIGIVGLGRMGKAIAIRLKNDKHPVIGFDVNKEISLQAKDEGLTIIDSLEELVKHCQIIWLMIPAGEIIDKVIEKIKPFLSKDHILVDGGNSKFTDSIERAKRLKEDNITFIDCGTSGGLAGEKKGFCLMIGGEKNAYDILIPFLKSIAIKNGYAYIGPSGSGHYVKMIHNGIEYSLMQSYAEGLHLIKEGSFKDANLNLEEITNVWKHGSIIRSWLLSLAHQVFIDHKDIENISGHINETGMGKWTLEDAKSHNIKMPCLKDSLAVRKWSRETGGNYATKIIALLRYKMGGHLLHKKDKQ